MREYRTVGNQEYEIAVVYDIGGHNGYTNSKRGYRLRIVPVVRKDLCVTYTFDFGETKKDELRLFLLEVKRKSAKKEEEAIDIAKPLIDEHFAKLESMSLIK